ncbi:MAG: pyrroline-5-carboxylate reductase [Dehalococcoidia bacterium]|nr:pyrroline-5-carboxylate reductase [Dehalococcoidia bacterium]
MKLTFIGGGVMGEAIIGALLNKGIVQAADIAVCDIAARRRRHLERTYRIKAVDSSAAAITGSDIVVLAMKPQDFPAAAKGMHSRLKASQTVLSIMAGISTTTIRDRLGHEAIVRAMPNTPAQIGEGMTVWTATEAVSPQRRRSVQEVLGALGQEIYVEDEKYINMATAISGSGPAFIFLVMEALIDAAVHIGMRRDMATPIVIQTLLGSARYAQASGKHPADLRNMVTSPGGTTAEGLLALEQAGIRAAFAEAIMAAYEKAKQLGG